MNKIIREHKRVIMGVMIATVIFLMPIWNAAAQAATLNINTIECVQSEESGSDEIYLYKDGKYIWPSNVESEYAISSGQTVMPNVSVQFENRTQVELWEEDNSPDPDDLLGTISADASDPGTHTKEMIGFSYNYEVQYVVTP